MTGTHLVGHGADPADARRNVRCFFPGASPQEALEETRGLEDAQLDVPHAFAIETDGQCALALDAGQAVNCNRFGHISCLHLQMVQRLH